MKAIAGNDHELADFCNIVSSHLRCSSNTPALKCNLLAFLEMLSADDTSAQALVNSSLTSSLVLLLDHEEAHLRMSAATVLGILIRFATNIEVDVLVPGESRHNIVVVLTAHIA